VAAELKTGMTAENRGSAGCAALDCGPQALHGVIIMPDNLVRLRAGKLT
jgi:hypothetical protein